MSESRLAGIEGSLAGRSEEKFLSKSFRRREKRSAIHSARLARPGESPGLLAASSLLIERFLEGLQGDSLGSVARIDHGMHSIRFFLVALLFPALLSLAPSARAQ